MTTLPEVIRRCELCDVPLEYDAGDKRPPARRTGRAA